MLEWKQNHRAPPKLETPRPPPLRLGGVGNSPHEEKAAGALLVDKEQERAVDIETDLGCQWHEPHCGNSSSLGALLIHCYGTLVLELFQNGKESCQILSVGAQRDRRYGGAASHSGIGLKDHMEGTDHSWLD